MHALSLTGTWTALVTPFTADGSAIDWDAYEALVDSQLAGGVSGLVPCGTTGETPTLSEPEQRELVQRTVRRVAGRVPVMAGTGSNSTKKTVEASRAALEAGADAVMVVMPYYNKPSQDGMRAHVEAIAREVGAREVGAPIVLYNIPGRTGVELGVDTLVALLETCPNIIGVKDATGHVLHCQETLRRTGDRASILCGDDPLTVPMMSVGARGVISVTSNLYPSKVAAVTTAALAGRWEEARRAHLALLPVHRAMFVEPNPQPLKAALAARGRMQASVRLPLLPASEATRAVVARVMADYEREAP
ncbi:MAG: 4-hydroxy-tetrahydrodipicolinate synthase [Polyangiaceae bacterium]|nr:4-hydroxy-tetrahydrodipicolinate synthase [Polyangiaceae bacterium]